MSIESFFHTVRTSKCPDARTYPETVQHDDTKQLDAVLGYLVGRRLSTREICAALELPRSTYYEQRDHGRLITADNLITAAGNLDLNPVDLLVRYGLIPASAVIEYAQAVSGTLGVVTGTPAPAQTKQANLRPECAGAMILLAYAVALTAISWTQWVRRGTWRNPWESPTTAASLMLGIALVLIAPAMEPVTGRALFLIAGRWHLDDLLGHIIAAAGLASSTLAGLMRMPSMRDRIMPLLHCAVHLAVAAMVPIFLSTQASHDPTPDLFLIPHDHHWIHAYFVVLWALLVYLGALNAWVAMNLRQDPAHRRQWPTHGSSQWASVPGRLLGWALPWMHLTAWYDWGRMSMRAPRNLFAIATARSWQRKLHPFRVLIKATQHGSKPRL